jgi:HEAT repeat protein
VLPALRDANPEIRAVSADVLGKFKHPETVAPLERLLASDGDARVRRAAASALGELASASSASVLGAALGDADLAVRRAAADALGELHEYRIAPRGLVTALTSSDAELRHRAARALCSIADPSTTSAILGLLSDPDSEIRKNAVEALGTIGSKDALSGLTRALGDKDPQVRRAAVEALGEMKDK